MRILYGQYLRTIVAPIVFFVSFFMLDPGLVAERLRNDVFDLFQRLEPRQDTDSPVLMVDIDETSLARFGQWPWPRPLLARLVDKAAIELGVDALELRRKNFITPDKFPHKIPGGNVYDSGNYEAVLQEALKDARLDHWRAEQAKAREDARGFHGRLDESSAIL
jgi:hypothetical protein